MPDYLEFKDFEVRPTPTTPEKGKLHADVYYKGEKCQVIVSEDKIALRLSSLMTIRHDLIECMTCLIKHQTESGPLIKTSLFKNFIITYGRCFVSAQARNISLLKEKVFKDCPSNFYQTHDFLMGLRHNFVAHHSDREIDSAYVFVATAPAGTDDKSFMVLPSIDRNRSLFSDEEIENIEPLIHHLIEYIKEEVASAKEGLGKKLFM